MAWCISCKDPRHPGDPAADSLPWRKNRGAGSRNTLAVRSWLNNRIEPSPPVSVKLPRCFERSATTVFRGYYCSCCKMFCVQYLRGNCIGFARCHSVPANGNIHVAPLFRPTGKRWR
ncbi:hypothetical protein TGVEG_440300 [Toxoplasma gondii VEG]|uniref:Uncharacterized protein n=1 Tax=Toxoplasma gondii (strain ATCC 50861 / VEG) TaxID=432359 RepID=V4ZFW5_TOXGV|nr:hypothetical protein TGVEG_440300 [Toxoplasma gondii VEG]